MVSLFLLILSLFPAVPVHAIYARPTPRTVYVYVTPPVRRVFVRRPLQPKKLTLWGQIMQKVGPAVLGSGGVIIGAAVAWYTLRKKTKAFDDYFHRITSAQNDYEQSLVRGIDPKSARNTLKTVLTGIQEEVELAVAKKKLDQEQLIAVSNKIGRILESRG